MDAIFELEDETGNMGWAAPEAAHSRLLNYLPGILSDDPFLEGFLRIFESILDPLDRQLGQLHVYFDPRLTPPEFLPWLGTWVDLVLDENWPEARRRELILRTADLYRRRGTALALRDFLEVYTGFSPTIIEESDDPEPFHFTVVLPVPHPEQIDRERVERIIEAEKPAHTTYTLRIEQGAAEGQQLAAGPAGLPAASSLGPAPSETLSTRFPPTEEPPARSSDNGSSQSDSQHA